MKELRLMLFIILVGFGIWLFVMIYDIMRLIAIHIGYGPNFQEFFWCFIVVTILGSLLKNTND